MLIHQCDKFLGYVEVQDQETAIRKAIKVFEKMTPFTGFCRLLQHNQPVADI
jgi:hypothetical protein